VQPRLSWLGVGPAAGLPRSSRSDVPVERPQLADRHVYTQRKRHGGFPLVAVDRTWRGPALAASRFGYSGRMCRVFRGATRRGRVAAAAATAGARVFVEGFAAPRSERRPRVGGSCRTRSRDVRVCGRPGPVVDPLRLRFYLLD
jgi:hypothetical protein